jgi:hypothetical protein
MHINQHYGWWWGLDAAIRISRIHDGPANYGGLKHVMEILQRV